jgi:hypothetical protein
LEENNGHIVARSQYRTFLYIKICFETENLARTGIAVSSPRDEFCGSTAPRRLGFPNSGTILIR